MGEAVHAAAIEEASQRAQERAEARERGRRSLGSEGGGQAACTPASVYRAISALEGKKGLDGPSESAIRSVMLGATYPWGKKERLRLSLIHI